MTDRGLGSVLKSLTKGFKISTGASNAREAPRTVIGGAPDLYVLLDKLSSKNSSSDRIKAAESIRASIDKYSVSSIPEIWYATQDMVGSSQQAECRRAGLRLLNSCIQHDEHVVGSRISYYKSIVSNDSLEVFDLQLTALKTLTNNARDVLDLNQSGIPLPRVLLLWLRRISSDLHDIRANKKRDLAQAWGTSAEEDFHQLLRFIISALKFNFAAFEHIDLQDLIKEVVGVTRKTSSSQDISLCVEILSSIMVFGYIPMDSLKLIVGILCGINISVSQLASQTWDLLFNLTKSHLGNSTIQALCDILESTRDKGVNSNTMRGAARFLQKVILVNASNEQEEAENENVVLSSGKELNYPAQSSSFTETPLPEILHAYKECLGVNSTRLDLEICSCVYELLSNKITRKKFTYEMWETPGSSPLEIIYKISQSDVVSVRSRIYKLESFTSKASGFYEHSEASSRATDTVGKITAKFQAIFEVLWEILTDKTFEGPKESLVNFFIDMAGFIDDKSAFAVIDQFEIDHYCDPLSSSWADNVDTLLKHFFLDITWSKAVRVRVLDLLKDVYDMSRGVCEQQVASILADRVFSAVEDEPDLTVLENAIELFITVGQECNNDLFSDLAEKFLRVFSQFDNPRRRISITTLGSVGAVTNSDAPPSEGASQLIARGFSKLFVCLYRTSAFKARMVYYHLLTICQKTRTSMPFAYLEAARILCRIRVTSANYVYITNPSNMDGLAASVGRYYPANPQSGSSSAEKPNSGSDRGSNNPSSQSSAWKHPEIIPYLSEENVDQPSPILKVRVTSEDIARLRQTELEIDISVWFNEILTILENGAIWDVYSFILAHFGPQLANVQLFSSCDEDIRRARTLICEQLTGKLPNLTLPKDISKSSIIIGMVRTTSSLIAYNDMFSKKDEDHLVQALVMVLTSSDQAAAPCIHALIVCCYEFPLSVKRYLGQIFATFQAKMTSRASSPHILELLLALARLPSLTDNFTQEEYKRVFGIAFKYIQHAHDLLRNPKAQEDARDTLHYDESGADMAPSTTLSPAGGRNLSQYLLVLAYSIVSTWFLTLKLENRKYMTNFIIRNLLIADGNTNNIDEQSMGCLDLITRFTYSNLDLMMQSTRGGGALDATSNNSDENSIKRVKRWVYGNSIVQIGTDTQTGESRVIVRRPTGTVILNMTPDEEMIPAWLEEANLVQSQSLSTTGRASGPGSGTTAGLGSESSVFTPNYFLLQLMVPTDIHIAVKPIPLPDDAATNRAVSAIDRLPVVDSHKISVVYIAPGQSKESEILANTTGSAAYRRFLDKLGKLVRLKGNRHINTGGLDTEMDIDGEYAYAWSDKFTQMIYHTTTMMPTNETDPSYSSKKRHIGNNYVSIYFNESDLAFDFNTIRSQFNFINIVVSPHTVAFFKPSMFADSAQTTNKAASSGGIRRNFYKVRAYRKAGVPAVFAACHLKIVSEEALPLFIRNLALIASKFATVWHSEGRHVSLWSLRLRQIMALGEKVEASANEQSSQTTTSTSQTSSEDHNKKAAEDSSATASVSIGQSFLDQLNQTQNTSSTREAGSGGFVFEPDTGDDLPLLKVLDFSQYT